MTTRDERHDHPLRSFIESTQQVVELLGAEDPKRLEAGLKHQIESFEQLAAAIESGQVSMSSELTQAIDAGRLALAEVRRRMHEVKGELDGLRSARARVSRRTSSRSSAHFVSRRV